MQGCAHDGPAMILENCSNNALRASAACGQGVSASAGAFWPTHLFSCFCIFVLKVTCIETY